MMQGVHEWVVAHPNIRAKKMIARWSRDSALVMFAYVFIATLLGSVFHHNPIVAWEHEYGAMIEPLAGFLGVLYVYVENSLKEEHK